MNTQIVGHQHIISSLEKSLQEKHAHAFLFVGDDHVGKTTVSDFVINSLIPEEYLKLNVFNISREEDKLIISIEQIIEMQKNITLKPANNSAVVVRINQPELLSLEAANRILKILEEPPEYVIFILISHNEHLILSTIKSRCQKIHFKHVSNNDIREFILNKHGVLPASFDKIINLAHGCPGKVIQAIESPEYFENYIQDLKDVMVLINTSSEAQLFLIQEWFSSRKSYIERKKKLEYTLSLLEELLHVIIAIQYHQEKLFIDGLEEISKKLSYQKIFKLFDALMEHKKQLLFNPDIRIIAHNITLLSTHQ